MNEPTVTVTTESDVRAPALSEPVTTTSVGTAASDTVDGFSDRSSRVDGVSSSARISSAGATVNPVTLPLTEIVSSPSAVTSFVGRNVNDTVPAVRFAGMVSSSSGISA